jgi:hypothetical protein
MTLDQDEATRDVAPGTASACDLLALPPAARAEHLALAKSLLFQAGQIVDELPGGLSFELPSSRLEEVVRFVENERRCCAHLRFVIEVPPRGAALELRITGTAVREALSALVFPSGPTSMAPAGG